MFTLAIFIRPDSELIRESVGTNRIVELNKTLTDSIRKRHKKEDSASCVKIKKRCYSDLLHFSTRKHNSVS